MITNKKNSRVVNLKKKKEKQNKKEIENPENNGLGIFNSLFRKYARWQA